jgi:pimeloyl-ACP methyl ester carboxylesterase
MILNFKGANIYFETHGKGAAIVLLHGFLENSSMWKDIVPELSKKNKVITIDLLGHGNSDCLGYVHTMELFAETVKAVLKYLKIRTYFLVGHSLGGYISLALAKMNSPKIKGLCLLNSTSYADSEERKILRTRAIKMARTNLKNMVQISIANLFYQENILLFSKEIEALKKEALKTSLQGYLAAQEGMKLRPNSSDFLKNATFKKLLIIGEKDPVIDMNLSLDEAKLTSTNFFIFDGGHMSYIENKDALLASLQSFFK